MNDKLGWIYNGFFKRMKNKPYLWGTIIGVFCLILFPRAIDYAYYIGDMGFCILKTSLDVGDVLAYYGSVLASISTAILGAVAVLQNTRLQKLEEDTAAKSSSCNVYVKNCEKQTDINLSNEEKHEYKKSDIKLRLSIKNYSEPFLKKICIQFGDKTFTSHITLAKDEEKYISVFLPENFEFDLKNSCKIIFTSCYNVETNGDFLVVKYDEYEAEIKYYHFYGTT